MISDQTRQIFTRIALGVSLLALLGTSQAKGWSLEAMPSGPRTAASGRALSLEIDASARPTVLAHGGPGSYASPHEMPCLDVWHTGAKMTCLVPPGVTLDSVVINGYCGGCQNGCPPPRSAFAHVTSAEVPAWTDSSSRSITTLLPTPESPWGWQFAIFVDGADAVDAKLSLSDSTKGTEVFTSEQACTLENGDSGTHAVCRIAVDKALFPVPTAVHAVFQVAGWGRCAAIGCVAPKTLSIASYSIR